LDEAEALLNIKPFYRAGRHFDPPSHHSMIFRQPNRRIKSSMGRPGRHRHLTAVFRPSAVSYIACNRENGDGKPESGVRRRERDDADVAAKIEATQAANEGQLLRVRTAIASMPASQRRYAWDAYRLLIRARTDADNAQQLAAVIQAGDAELVAAVKTLIDEINEARLRQDQAREESPPPNRPH
jgi:hypothetical protein